LPKSLTKSSLRPTCK